MKINSKSGDDIGNLIYSLDFIYSKKTLSAGHSFLVSFNKNDNFPQISRVFKEII